MIGSTRQLTIYVHTAPTDMRKSYDTLAALVVRDLGRDLLSGDVFIATSNALPRASARKPSGSPGKSRATMLSYQTTQFLFSHLLTQGGAR